MLNKICKKIMNEIVEKVVKIANATRITVTATQPTHVLNVSVLRQQYIKSFRATYNCI